MSLHRRHMFSIVPHSEQAAVNLRMQGFHAAIHHFWKTGQVRNIHDLQACIPQRLGRATGRNQFNSVSRQSRAELRKAGLVRNTQQCPFDLHVRHFFSKN